jgi:hypothetical protein
MAYKFFSQKLLSSNELDLSQVFPEKQELARESNNVSYNLADIVLFLKDRTEDFKFVEGQYIDLDNAISEIVNKYYKSKGEKNPFVDDIDEEALKDFEAGVVPREAVIVEEGKQKGKGVAKPAPDVKKSKEPKEEVVEVKVVETGMSDKVNKFKEELAKRKEIYDDVYDDDEKKEFKELMQKKLEADEFIAEDGDEYFVERVKILKKFINSLK